MDAAHILFKVIATQAVVYRQSLTGRIDKPLLVSGHGGLPSDRTSSKIAGAPGSRSFHLPLLQRVIKDAQDERNIFWTMTAIKGRWDLLILVADAWKWSVFLDRILFLVWEKGHSVATAVVSISGMTDHNTPATAFGALTCLFPASLAVGRN